MRPEISQYFTWCRQDNTWYIPLQKMRPSPLYGSVWQLYPGSVYNFEYALSKKELRGCLPLVFLDDRETSVRIGGRSLSSIQELYPPRVKIYSGIDDSGDFTFRDNMWWGLEPQCQRSSYLIRSLTLLTYFEDQRSVSEDDIWSFLSCYRHGCPENRCSTGKAMGVRCLDSVRTRND